MDSRWTLTRSPSIPRRDPHRQPSPDTSKAKASRKLNHEPTLDIPFGRSKTSAKRTSPAIIIVSVAVWDGAEDWRLTLSHEILEVAPLDVVRQVANVDAAVLLRIVAGIGHGVVLGGAVVGRAGAATVCVARTGSGARVGATATGTARATSFR